MSHGGDTTYDGWMQQTWPPPPAPANAAQPDGTVEIDPSATPTGQHHRAEDPAQAAKRALADLRPRVQQVLDDFLAKQRPILESISTELIPIAQAGEEFLAGGKRLRAAFCYWGWRGTGAPDAPEIVRAASALELLQGCALVHDDVMDDSHTRRGVPAMHRRFAALHREQDWHGSPDSHGQSSAILLGDLYLSWSDEVFSSNGLPAEATARARPLYDVMRTELMAGQYLDLAVQARRASDRDSARRVLQYKSAKYTIERPLQLGGLLADATAELINAYSAYGLPLGEAFQLRDDVLGVFGDPDVTGKPAGDDLREGKRTVLIASALDHADQAQRTQIETLLGNVDLDGDGVATLRQIITETGALAEVERQVDALYEQALSALLTPELDDTARMVLQGLAAAAARRSS